MSSEDTINEKNSRKLATQAGGVMTSCLGRKINMVIFNIFLLWQSDALW